MLTHIINVSRHLKIHPQITSHTPFYSTSLNPPPKSRIILQFLTNSPSLSQEEANLITTQLGPLKSIQNPTSVTNFLKRSGFDDAQIRKIVAGYPKILTTKVEENLEPKLRVLMDLGLSPGELVIFMTAKSGLLRRGLGSVLVPLLDTMRGVLGNNADVIKALKKKGLFSRWLPQRGIVKENVEMLRACGVSEENIKKVMVRNLQYLCLNKSWLKGVVNKVKDRLGLCGDSRMFWVGIKTFGSMTDKTLESKFKVFRSYGWDDEDILKLARGSPFTLMTSEGKLRTGLDFFMKEQGYHPGTLAGAPVLLNLSLDKRIRPRIAVLKLLKDKKLLKESVSLISVLRRTESEFLRSYIERHKDRIPELYEVYMKNLNAASEATG